MRGARAPGPRRPSHPRTVALAIVGAALRLAAPEPAAAGWLAALTGGGRVEVEVRERPGEDSWEASYRLPSRSAGVEFLRSREAFRHSSWTAAPEGASWSLAGTRERLCLPSASRVFTLTFRSDFTPRRKDYDLNAAFTDGSRLLFTGHLLVRPLASCTAASPEPPDDPDSTGPDADTVASLAEPAPRHRFRFTTAPGRPVRVLERAAVGSLTWDPLPADAETYVLFGPAPVAEGERATLVLDPGLPAWLGHEVVRLLPPLFERFAAETGLHLSRRPLVLLSFRAPGSGRSFEGGVVGAVLAMDASGEGWLAESPAARRDWFLRLAHEAFHFWGGGELLADDESEWLSEAAAELFALRAAWAFGVLDYGQYEQAVVDAANQCLAGQQGAALLSAPARGAFDTWYSCGMVLLFTADRAVERARPGAGGIALLFREMLAEGRLSGNRYGTGLLLGWLDRLSGDRDTVFALQRLIRRGVERGADRFLHQLLVAAGLRVGLVPPEEAGGDPAAVHRMLRRGLTRCACGSDDPERAGDGDCARFAGHHRLGLVGGIEVRRDPTAAYGRLRAAALLGRPLEVVTGEPAQSLTLLCPRDVLDPSFERLLVRQ